MCRNDEMKTIQRFLRCFPARETRLGTMIARLLSQIVQVVAGSTVENKYGIKATSPGSRRWPRRRDGRGFWHSKRHSYGILPCVIHQQREAKSRLSLRRASSSRRAHVRRASDPTRNVTLACRKHDDGESLQERIDATPEDSTWQDGESKVTTADQQHNKSQTRPGLLAAANPTRCHERGCAVTHVSSRCDGPAGHELSLESTANDRTSRKSDKSHDDGDDGDDGDDDDGNDSNDGNDGNDDDDERRARSGVRRKREDGKKK